MMIISSGVMKRVAVAVHPGEGWRLKGKSRRHWRVWVLLASAYVDVPLQVPSMDTEFHNNCHMEDVEAPCNRKDVPLQVPSMDTEFHNNCHMEDVEAPCNRKDTPRSFISVLRTSS
eukprot:TRINITY_DN1779_c0_g1_i1.p3 TRINITY_DN1779_c0_g1~~TRINITY_DN1779_c0_g1_i1.p3  ORF type:complete len:116 (-),score=9.04 TRINITY_DN1779_c0_g1_i1:106-453(-)